MRYGSAKISYSIIEKMLEDSITSNEISVLIWLALYQDEYGRTFNVKYKDVCKDMIVSFQGYYDCVNGLEEKGYVRTIARNYTSGWDIEILNNSFVSREDDKKRYLNINRDVFFEKNFLDLKANEKKILMKVIMEYRPERDYYINITQIGKWIGIENMQLLRSYIEKIKIFFRIGYKKKYNKDKKIIIFQRYNKDTETLYENKTIFYHYTKSRLRALLRQYKVQYIGNEMDDLIKLVYQYKENFGLLYQIIIDTICLNRSIRPKLINHLITKKLNPQT